MTGTRFIPKAAIVLAATLALLGAGSVLGPRTAHAATAADCGFRAFDVDSVSMPGKIVAFGDAPSGTTFGSAVVCFASGRQQIVVKGTAYWVSPKAGCGIVGFGPTYQSTDPPVDGLTEVHVCSGHPSEPVSLTFSTTSQLYAGLGISTYLRGSDGHITNLANQVVHYGDTNGQ